MLSFGVAAFIPADCGNSLLKSSTLSSILFNKIFSKEEYYLKDHIVNKNNILPGVAYIEMARAAGAVYKINEGTGGTVLINLELFDDYMEQFREKAVPMKNPLWNESES